MKTIGQMLNMEPAGEPTHTNDTPLMQFTSHVEGKNAKVAIYTDRIEWARTGLKPPGGVTGVVLSGGLSLALPGRKDTNMIPIRQIQGITTHKAGLSYTTVRVATAGDATEFRVTKREAQQVKSTLLQLMNQPAQPVTNQPMQQAASLVDSTQLVADEIRKLADLRDAGLLTDVEFAAQKARLLGS
jgi:hypothetical protein